VLLGAAEREDGPVVALQIGLDLAPVHLADAHARSPILDDRRTRGRAKRLDPRPLRLDNASAGVPAILHTGAREV